jgi:arylformamidase
MIQKLRIMGPAVWRDMDQTALDNAYDQAVYAPNRDAILTRIATASEQTRNALGPPDRFPYGSSEQEYLDIYRAPGKSPAPINVYVHGGAWRQGSASRDAFTAEPLVRAGAHSVIIDFMNVDQTGGDLMPMYHQVSRAIAWSWRNCSVFGGDPDRLFVSAHSSGAHLAACALTRGWREEALPADFCKGVFLASGMYDLAPVRLSKRSTYVSFTDPTEHNLSPIRHLDGLMTPLVLACGTAESPEFQRQTREFFSAVAALGKSAELVIAEDHNHFEMLESLAYACGTPNC